MTVAELIAELNKVQDKNKELSLDFWYYPVDMPFNIFKVSERPNDVALQVEPADEE